MRKRVWLTVVLGGLWSAYWGGANWGANFAVDKWIESSKSQGTTVTISERSGGGFPLRGQQVLKDINLTQGNTSLRIPNANLSIPLYKPGSAAVSLSKQTIEFETPQQTLGLKLSDNAKASGQVNLGTALELRNINVESAAFELQTDRTTTLSGESLSFDLTQSSEKAETYQITSTIKALTPAQPLRDALGLPSDWPQTMNPVLVNATVTFDRPLDRTAKPGNRPQPRQIDIENLSAGWGVTSLTTSGGLAVDKQGIPTGKILIEAKNWRETLVVLEGSGAIDRQARQRLEGLLGGFAQASSGNAQDLKIEVTFEGGQMRVGFIPLGPAPRIYLQ